jgi:hypothetical protein
MQRAPGGQGFDRVDIGVDYPDIPFRQSRGRSPALLKLFVAHGGAGIDQDIADTQLLDEAQRLLPGSGADRHHADHGTDAKHNAERGEQRSRLLRAQVSECLAEIREDDHFCRAFMTPSGWLELPDLPC